MKPIPSLTAVLGLASMLSAPAASLLAPGDAIFSYDLDANDQFPSNEAPADGVDGNAGTKYLNFGGRQSGIIMTPTSGSSSVQSFNFITGNDAPERDPTSYLLFGTNDVITSTNLGTTENRQNVNGFNENWTFISGGALNLPGVPDGGFGTERGATSAPIDIVNGSSYNSYWMVFPTLKGGDGQNVMQFANLSLYDAAGGGGTNVVGGSSVVGTSWDGPFPGGESAFNLLDGDAGTKFLSFGKENAGIWVVPQAGATTVRSFKITTGGDEPPRDPASYRLLGQDGSGVWTEIDSGSLALTVDRGAESDYIPVDNNTEYLAYRMEFDQLKDSGSANSIQFAEIQFFDVIPEPSTSLLAGLGLLGLLARRRRG